MLNNWPTKTFCHHKKTALSVVHLLCIPDMKSVKVLLLEICHIVFSKLLCHETRWPKMTFNFYLNDLLLQLLTPNITPAEPTFLYILLTRSWKFIRRTTDLHWSFTSIKHNSLHVNNEVVHQHTNTLMTWLDLVWLGKDFDSTNGRLDSRLELKWLNYNTESQ